MSEATDDRMTQSERDNARDDAEESMADSLRRFMDTGTLDEPPSEDQPVGDEAASGDNPVAEEPTGEAGEGDSPTPDPAETPTMEEVVLDPDDTVDPMTKLINQTEGGQDSASVVDQMIADQAAGLATTQQQFDIARYLELATGRQWGAADIDQLLATDATVRQMTPAQIDAVNRILSGEAVADPTPAPTPAPAPQATPQYVPGVDPAMDTLMRDEPELFHSIQNRINQGIEAATAPVAEQLRRIEQERINLERQQLQRQNEERQAQMSSGANAFVDDHPEFTQEEHAALQRRLVDSGQINVFLAHDPDPSVATKRALEATAWAMPELQAKMVARVAAKETEQASADADRVQKISALGGGSGSTSATGTMRSSNEGDSLVDDIRKILSQ